jgi:hypothetical protein
MQSIPQLVRGGLNPFALEPRQVRGTLSGFHPWLKGGTAAFALAELASLLCHCEGRSRLSPNTRHDTSQTLHVMLQTDVL